MEFEASMVKLPSTLTGVIARGATDRAERVERLRIGRTLPFAFDREVTTAKAGAHDAAELPVRVVALKSASGGKVRVPRNH